MLWMLLCAPAQADEATDKEVHRHVMEMDRLAAKNAWAGVERHYEAIVELGENPERRQHILAADAAQQRGDVVTLMERLEEAQAIEKTIDVAMRSSALLEEYALVRLRCAPHGAELVVDQAPFHPHQGRAIDFAAATVVETGTFTGFLPVGSYTFGGHAFQAVPHTKMDVLDLTADQLESVETRSLGGVSMPKNMILAGKVLRLNGMGIREKAYVDVYVAGLYLLNPTTDAQVAMNMDEPKRLIIHFVYRKVSRTQLISAWMDAFTAIEGIGHLSTRIDMLNSWMRDVVEGDRLVLDYVPNKGTTVTISGRRQGTIEGADFNRVMMSVWLGDNPPGMKLKRGLLGE